MRFQKRTTRAKEKGRIVLEPKRLRSSRSMMVTLSSYSLSSHLDEGRDEDEGKSQGVCVCVC